MSLNLHLRARLIIRSVLCPIDCTRNFRLPLLSPTLALNAHGNSDTYRVSRNVKSGDLLLRLKRPTAVCAEMLKSAPFPFTFSAAIGIHSSHVRMARMQHPPAVHTAIVSRAHSAMHCFTPIPLTHRPFIHCAWCAYILIRA